ncbi:MAG: hypothetical protein IJR69_02610 [Bacteroidaceae bacterium]|nr:hypothetical protein [Bacteroidaceae bacterium]
MTFQIFNQRVFVIALFMMASVSIHAQQPSMQALIGQSLSKLQQPTPEAFLNCVAEMKRIEAMFPDSIQPKYQMALQSLNISVMNPQAPQTENLMAEAEQTITKMEQMKNADQSDICTLRGFLYMVRIVQNPAQNGQRYYMDVMQNYEKALKLNPDNKLAKQLQQKFFEGMKQQTSRQ